MLYKYWAVSVPECSLRLDPWWMERLGRSGERPRHTYTARFLLRHRAVYIVRRRIPVLEPEWCSSAPCRSVPRTGQEGGGGTDV
jgi:hypothetical protein